MACSCGRLVFVRSATEVARSKTLFSLKNSCPTLFCGLILPLEPAGVLRRLRCARRAIDRWL
jgi:hypothetical protein